MIKIVYCNLAVLMLALISTTTIATTPAPQDPYLVDLEDYEFVMLPPYPTNSLERLNIRILFSA